MRLSELIARPAGLRRNSRVIPRSPAWPTTRGRSSPGDLFVARVGQRFDGRAFARGGGGAGRRGRARTGLPTRRSGRALARHRRSRGRSSARSRPAPTATRTASWCSPASPGRTASRPWPPCSRRCFDAAGRPAGFVGTWATASATARPGRPHHPRGLGPVPHSAARCADAGAEAVAMEVSSHALAMGRVDGAAFDVAVFTNLTRDHLDLPPGHGGLLRGQAPALRHAQARRGGRRSTWTIPMAAGWRPSCRTR